MRVAYQNPLPIKGIGDPFVLAPRNPRFAGRFYLYATSAKDGFLCWSSENLTDWTAHGYCFSGASWATDCYWAPECTEYEGHYYLFYSANWSHNPSGELETFRIGVAVSDSPLGPFNDVGQPLFDPGFPVIDANVFIDRDGKKYLTCSRCCYKHKIGPYEESHIYGAELNADMTAIEGELRLLLKPEQEWESQSAASTGRRWNEGSFLLEHDGLYYMLFSANHYQDKEYAIGYATAKHPLGPYVKAQENPILAHDFPRVSGPGHNSVVKTPSGQYLIVYHAHTNPEKGGGDRQVCIDSMSFVNGKIVVDGPSTQQRFIEL